MKKTLAVLSERKNPLAVKTEQVILEKLPVDQKTLNRAMKILEPKNLKRLCIGAIGGSILVTILSNIGKDQIYRASVGQEIKKQLAPMQKKLDELEAQNAALYLQNKELMEKIDLYNRLHQYEE